MGKQRFQLKLDPYTLISVNFISMTKMEMYQPVSQEWLNDVCAQAAKEIWLNIDSCELDVQKFDFSLVFVDLIDQVIDKILEEASDEKLT